jgi:hypothetical protein
MLQKLSVENGVRNIPNDLVSIDARGAEAAADWRELRSGENYLGYERTENFSSCGGIKADKTHAYTAPESLPLNGWALSGDWTIGKEAVVLNQSHGSISYRFHARDLHVVMAPAAHDKPVWFRVLIDGQSPGAAHGVDVDEDGNGAVMESRMYQLIRQSSHISDRKFEIHFRDAGVKAFSFTFG